MNKILEKDLLNLYNFAKEQVLYFGYEPEIIWQSNLCKESFSETEFLRESAWVILCSGFKEAYVRKIFNIFSLCFCDWESAISIINKADICRDTACKVFQNTKKIDAIIKICEQICETGFNNFKEDISKDPINQLKTLPFIGPITSFHLAKNLGFYVAKPDRHLVRMATVNGFDDVQEFCTEISHLTGEKLPVVDIVLWRYAELSARKFAIS